MIIEAVRLVVTLSATAVGFILGSGAPGWTDAVPNSDAGGVLGAVIGAGVGYVAGGLFGRLVRRGVDMAPAVARNATGPQLFAGAFGFLAGLLVGAVAAVPAIVLLPEVLGWSIGSLVVVVLAAVGAKVFHHRAEDLLAAAGLGRPRPLRGDGRVFVIDTSAAIDGRILEVMRSGLVRGELRVPGFVLEELQGIADSGSLNTRRRGRRGLDVLDALASVPGVDLRVDERTYPEFPDVDAKLVGLAIDAEASLVTTDHNLARVAALRGVEVLNLQSLGESLRNAPVTGDRVALLIEKAGSEPGQGVGYLEDGTMVVVEGVASRVGETIEIEIASALRTSVGRMLFGRLAA